MDEEAAGMGLLKQRTVMFDALNYLPTIKNATEASIGDETTATVKSKNKAKASVGSGFGSAQHHASSSKASLASKLDVLDDMLLKFKLFAEK